jgi:hypothetical protein
VSVLTEWWRELRDGGKSESEAVRVIAGRLGESEVEARRVLSTVARVKFGGKGGARPAAPPAVSANGARPAPAPIDTAAMCDFYRRGRLTGLRHEHALKAVARRFGMRPCDARSIRRRCSG